MTTKQTTQQNFEPLMVPARKGFRMIPVGPTKGYELINSSVLDARKVGRLTMITMASIRRYVDNLPRLGSESGNTGGRPPQSAENPDGLAEGKSATGS